MATSRTAQKPPMQSFARMIARSGRRRETVLDLPSRAVRIGDPVTDQGGRVELGVASAAMFVTSVGFGEDEDNAAIVVRARPTVAVRWELGATGGVDSGTFGVWDADARTTDGGPPVDGGTPAEGNLGGRVIDGRRVFTLQTGDGFFPCVVGFDDRGEVCAVVAGPGVDPVKFRAVLREEQMTEAERAEKAAQDARDARLVAMDLLGEKLGAERASPPLRWFVAGWLDSMSEEERAAAREELAPALEGLALPRGEKKARERAKADTAALLAWALSGWATVLEATMPEQVALVRVGQSLEKKEMGWVENLERVFDHRMTARRYDLTLPYQLQLTREHWEAWYGRGRADRKTAMHTALQDVPRDLAARFGLLGLRTMVEKTAPHEKLGSAFWYASRGLEQALELHVLATRTADLAPIRDGAPERGVTLRPRDPAYVEELLARVETPAAFLLRLAGRA